MSRWAKPPVKTSMGELGDPAVRGYLLRVLAPGRDVEGNAFDLASYNHEPEELRGELVAAGLADILVLGIKGPLGAQARFDVSLADTAITERTQSDQPRRAHGDSARPFTAGTRHRSPRTRR
jgi:hypothetical protein